MIYYPHPCHCLSFLLFKITDIPVTFETAWVLAALAQGNHTVDLCSGPLLVCRRRASLSVLGITSLGIS